MEEQNMLLGLALLYLCKQKNLPEGYSIICIAYSVIHFIEFLFRLYSKLNNKKKGRGDKCLRVRKNSSKTTTELD